MPRTNLLILTCIATAALAHPAERGKTTRPVFYARRLASPAERISILRTVRILSSPVLDTALADFYNNIDPEKSLFIDDCADWCSDSAFSFATRFSVAATLASPENPDTVLPWWIQSASSAIPLLDPSIVNTLELAGVVNRIDYATANQDGTWSNVELRFVYAPPDNSVNFRLILEFTLHPLTDPDLRALAQDWYALSSLNGPAFLTKLKGIVAGHPFDLVRLRTNANFSNPGAPWSFAQWEFASGSYRQTSLTDQILDCCRKSLSVGQAPPTCANYRQVWTGLLAQSTLPLYWHIQYPELMPQQEDYPSGSPVNGEMPGMTIPNDLGVTPTCEARDLLAVQQCSLCHGAETETSFKHVGDKISPTKRDLSLFLRGLKTRPTFDDYQHPDPSVFYKVDVRFETPSGISCKRPVTPCLLSKSGNGLNYLCETQYFHDLGRRMMSLASILVKQPSGGIMDPIVFQAFRRALIDSYAPHMVH